MTFTNKDFEKAYPELRNYAFYLTNNDSEDAEDLLQDTFLKMLEKTEKFSEGNEKGYTIEKWGASIMHNLFIDKKRRMKHFIQSSSVDDLKNISIIIDFQSKFNNDAIIREKSRMVKKIIRNNIKKKNNKNKFESYLQIFIYRCLGLTYMEIANLMDSNSNSIKSKFFNMKADLGELLKIK